MTVATLKLTEPRVMTGIGVGLLVLSAWLALIVIHGDAGLALESIAELCGQIGGSVALWFYPAVLFMWLLMAIAMMLPTALPTIDLYVQLSRRMESGRSQRIVLFVAGYVVAWGAFGALAAALQITLRAIPVDDLAPVIAAGSVLILAGLYQFSALKQKCLALCHNPMLFFMSRWRETYPGTLRLGIEHGLICIGCCWALMLLMFVTGAMNLVWMAMLGLAMLLEKLLPDAGTWGRVAGALMIAAGAVTIGTILI
ncbi:MAG: DUF2182 domain-containing protein [Pseudomonadota bacterium]